MKKTWVALAVAGAFFAGAAQAQSSVTLYGIIDINYMWQELPTNVGTAAAPRVQQESFSAINSGHQSGSRWGLRGSEDLGGGMKAIFAVEGGYSNDTGAMGQGGLLFGRQAYAGLGTNWGSVVAGRLATFSSGTGDFDMFGRTDPFSTGFGLASLGNTFYSANALRIDNTIAYVSPTFSGFKGAIGYSTRIAGNEVAPSSANADAIASAINWAYGPFWVGVTYDSIDNPAPGADDQEHLQIGATFDIGAFRLHAGYANQKNIGAVPSVMGGTGSYLAVPAGFQPFDTSAYMAGVTWTIGAFKVFGSFQMQDADNQTGPTRSFDPDFDIWAIGGAYNLSRRTNLYASYAQRNADGTFQSESFDAKQFAVGMRHLF